MKKELLKAPFPYPGGKMRAAARIWAALGSVDCYVEPFFGSGAVLLSRPNPAGVETVNDADGLVVNFWRAVRADPQAVAHAADWPVTELDLTARHLVMVEEKQSLTARLEADPEYFSARLAGWWAWGACVWIGSGWCAGDGPWQRVEGENGPEVVNRNGDAGTGVNRQLPHLGDAGKGVNRQLPHLGDAGTGLYEWIKTLSHRLRRVRVTCGDFSRVLGPSVTTKHGLTGVFLDPPYAAEGHHTTMYAISDSEASAKARRWAIEHGNDPLLRIVLAGYEGEHDMPAGWRCEAWKAGGGYSNQGENNENRKRERLWFSPNCLNPTPQLFGLLS